MKSQILLFYKYVSIEDSDALRAWFIERGIHYHLTGRIIIAEEGVNGTVEGIIEDTEAFAKEFLADARFSDVVIKRSEGTGTAFKKLSVKVRDEIVGTHFPKEVDPRVKTAPRLRAEELRTWFEKDKEFVVVDMRNDYEYQAGHFKNSINPGLEASRDLPNAMDKLAPLKNTTVLTVCTGGIRCEKMSAYLMHQGFTDVYQLDNGIHGYMEKYPGKDFDGALYTFDERIVMDFGGEREIIGKCHLCTAPTELYVNCVNNFCHLHFLACENCQNAEGTACSKACLEKVSTNAS